MQCTLIFSIILWSIEYYFFLKNASHTHETEWTVAICFEIPAPNFRWSELCTSLSEPASFLWGESLSGPSVFPVSKLDDHHHDALGRFSPFTLGSQSALGEGSEDGGYLLPAPQPQRVPGLSSYKMDIPQKLMDSDAVTGWNLLSFGSKLWQSLVCETWNKSRDVLETHPENISIFPLYSKMLNKLGALGD